MNPEVVWASGLFEGEGTVTMNGRVPRLALVMVDADTVHRFADAIGIGSVYPEPATRKGWSDCTRWQCSGFEKVQAVLAMLWGGLGERRRRRAREVLNVGRGTEVM